MADSTLTWAKTRLPLQRECICCKATKVAGEFYAHRYITNQGKFSTRLDSECKACSAAKRKEPEHRTAANARQRKRRTERPEVTQAYLAKRRAEQKPVILEKKCAKCEQVKPVGKFYKRLINSDGVHSQCRACVMAVSTEYARTIEPHRISTWKQKSHLKSRYGISLEEYEYLASAQDNKCLICDACDVYLYVDHCHATGRIRGLLCRACNLALGFVFDSKDRAQSLLRYIEQRCGT